MNKYLSALLFSAALLSISNAAQAQYTGPKLSLNASPASAKTTDTKRRIIAEAKYGYTTADGYLKTDSTRLEWYGDMSHDRYPTIQPLFTYDKAASNEHYQALLPDPMRPYTRTQRIYNSNNEMVYSVQYNWNTSSSSWDSATRTSYVYIGGKLLQDETQQKVAGKNWLSRTKNEYLYKAGLLDEKISYTYRYVFLSDLKYLSKTNYTYTSGVVSSITTAFWDSSASVSPGFYNRTRLHLTFSGKDTTQKTTQTWDNSLSDWRNTERKSFNFSKGPYSEDLTEKWNTASSSWQNYAKDSLIYSGGLLVNHILFEWIAGSKTWGATQVYAFEYTGANLTGKRQLQWDGSKWTDDYLTEYQYDSYNDVNRALLFRWDGSKFVPVAYDAAIYYYYAEYTPTALSHTALLQTKAAVFPNPALNNHSYLDFNTDQDADFEVQVIDMTGKEVYRVIEPGHRGDHSVLLPLDGLSGGTYLVSLSCAGQLQSQQKLIKL